VAGFCFNRLAEEAPFPAVHRTDRAPGAQSKQPIVPLSPGQLDALQLASFTLFTVTLLVVGQGDASLDILPTAVLSDGLGDSLPKGSVQGGPFTGIARIPTLSQSGFLLLILALLSGGLYHLLRRKVY